MALALAGARQQQGGVCLRPVMSPAFWRDLAHFNPFGDPTISDQDVRDWFEWIWPVYRARRYKRHDRAIREWWQRANRRELERARECGENLRARAEADAIGLLPPGGPPTVDYFAQLKQ